MYLTWQLLYNWRKKSRAWPIEWPKLRKSDMELGTSPMPNAGTLFTLFRHLDVHEWTCMYRLIVSDPPCKYLLEGFTWENIWTNKTRQEHRAHL